MRQLPLLRSAMLVLAATAVGCSQAGTPLNRLTAPSAVFEGSLAAQGEAYDATGAWDAILTFPDGDTGSGVLNIVQDANGDLIGTGEGDPGTYTFRRNGNGTGDKVRYRLTIVSPDPGVPGECGRDIAGQAILDTQTHTMETHNLKGVIDDCSTIEFSITLTRQ